LLKKTNNDSTSKRSRIQAAFSPRNITNEKKTNTVLTDSVGVFSHTTNNTSGPGGGIAAKNETIHESEQPNVVAALAQHTNAVMPVASLGSPSGKSHLINTNSTTSSSSAKQFLTRGVRSRSKSDSQSVSDKSLFSRIFSKKSKKPMGTLITTTTNSIDLDVNPKRVNLINKSSLKTNKLRSTIDEEEEDDYGDDNELEQSTTSDDFLSGIGKRTKSATERKYKPPPNPLILPTSDSQYYASMSSAPTGFSISYHKHEDIRLQAAPARLQQENKKGTTDSGASQLMVSHLLLYIFFSMGIFFSFFLPCFPVHCVFCDALWGFIVFTYSWQRSNNVLTLIRKGKRCSEMREKKMLTHLLVCLFCFDVCFDFLSKNVFVFLHFSHFFKIRNEVVRLDKEEEFFLFFF
jgi:hypothetical protein